jgi:hypothetical protein
MELDFRAGACILGLLAASRSLIRSKNLFGRRGNQPVEVVCRLCVRDVNGPLSHDDAAMAAASNVGSIAAVKAPARVNEDRQVTGKYLN